MCSHSEKNQYCNRLWRPSPRRPTPRRPTRPALRNSFSGPGTSWPVTDSQINRGNIKTEDAPSQIPACSLPDPSISLEHTTEQYYTRSTCPHRATRRPWGATNEKRQNSKTSLTRLPSAPYANISERHRKCLRIIISHAHSQIFPLERTACSASHSAETKRSR